MLDKKEIYTVQEIADYLRVSTRTINRYIKQGLIKAIMIGEPGKSRTARIPYSSVSYLVEEEKQNDNK